MAYVYLKQQVYVEAYFFNNKLQLIVSNNDCP